MGEENRMAYSWSIGDKLSAIQVILGILAIIITCAGVWVAIDPQFIKKLIRYKSRLVIKINSPIDGDKVRSTIEVSGTIAGEVPIGQELWLYVYAAYLQKYYFYPIRRLPNSQVILVKDVPIGSQPPMGGREEFKIGIVQVSQSDGDTSWQQQGQNGIDEQSFCIRNPKHITEIKVWGPR